MRAVVLVHYLSNLELELELELKLPMSFCMLFGFGFGFVSVMFTKTTLGDGNINWIRRKRIVRFYDVG